MAETNFAALVGGLVEEGGEPQGARLKEVPLAEIYEDPNNPRTTFDKRELEALAASIREKSLLQPITVRPKDERGHMIRYGARRYRAALLAGLEKIPAIITTSDASEADILAAQVIENDQREGLNTAEMAGAVQRLLDLGLSQAQIAEKLGRPKDQVSMYAAVKDMPQPLQDLAPKLGVRTLYELSGAWKRDAKRTAALVSAKGEEITTAEARTLSAELKAAKASPAAGKGASGGKTPAAATETSAEAGKGRRGQGSLDIQTSADAADAAGSRGGRLAGFDVKIGKRMGRLILEAGPDPETVLIAYEEGGSLEPTPVANVRLVRSRSE
jgi:ParB family chromosome partitioning protein